MAINEAMYSAVSALHAQAGALESISSNIANSQTTAYKRTESSFYDLVVETTPEASPAAGVTLEYRSTAGIQGSIVPAAESTFLAISGSGYFVVAEGTSQANGDTVFSAGQYYTRRGDFQLDKNGHFVNGSGYYLMGLPVNSATGEVSGSALEVISAPDQFLAPRATTEIEYQANLPQQPINDEYNAGGDGLYNGAALASVSGDDSESFLEQSIPGGTVTVYNEAGEAVTVELRWAKTANADPNAVPPVEDTWNLYYLSDPDATGTDTKWTNVGVDYTFNSAGAPTGASTADVTLAGMTVDGVFIGDVQLQHGSKGLTQYADSGGTVRLAALNQDGYAAGELMAVDIADSGRVTATYSNGVRVEFAQVVTADFNAPGQLQAMDSGIYAATAESGGPIININGDGIVSGALEASNTDITHEFTKLIITQQAYAAATRIMTTADEMMQEALNIVR